MESRDELLEWWARLLANAQDPERADGVRVSIVKAVKDFDPIDAVVLEGLRRAPDGHYKPDRLAEDLERRSDEIQSSVWRLGQLGVLVAHARANELARSFGVTPFGPRDLASDAAVGDFRWGALSLEIRHSTPAAAPDFATARETVTRTGRIRGVSDRSGNAIP